MADIVARNKHVFESFMSDSYIHRNVREILSKRLESMNFFTAPASTKFHGNYEGGLFNHSLAVAQKLVEITRNMGLVWDRPASPYIVGMFHDLCKCDEYRHPSVEEGGCVDTSKWVSVKDTPLKGHGDKSVMILSTLMRLTEEEVMCIRYHMGAFTDKEQWNEYTRAVKAYPNVLWTHTADMYASQVDNI